MTKEVTMATLVPLETITSNIHLIRGIKVMLDSDLSELYGVSTKRFNEQIRRNLERFPSDFMFRLTKEEYNSLRSQVATSSTTSGHGADGICPLFSPNTGLLWRRLS
jgi:hypothetical protein